MALDQLTKWWATEALADGRTIEVVWTLRFRLVRNPGTAFSLLSGMGSWLGLLALLVVAALVVASRRVTSSVAVTGLGLVLGGAIGNLVDRMARRGEGFLGGHVVDFIDLQWWPVFNVADMGIVIGAGLLVLFAWRHEPDRPPSGDRPPQGCRSGEDAGGRGDP